jgi:hypothetical protein
LQYPDSDPGRQKKTIKKYGFKSWPFPPRELKGSPGALKSIPEAKKKNMLQFGKKLFYLKFS